MRFVEHYILLILAGYSSLAFGQDKENVSILFNPISKENFVNIDDTIILDNGSFIKVSQFKFYISDLRTTPEISSNNYHLLDLSNPGSLKVNILEANQTNQLFFNLGIDSVTNMKGAQGGDLDPTKGMYWTWQSGYINCKLEGTYTNNAGNESAFTFHFGGFMADKNAVQLIQLPSNNQKDIEVNIDLFQFFNEIDLTTTNMVMSPSKTAVELSKKLAECFSAIEK
jgi:hypothetical protein